MGHSCRTRLQNERFVQDFLQKSRVKSTKRRSHTRILPKFTRQVSKLACFARDFLKSSRLRSAKRAYRTRLPPKVMRQVSKTSVSHETSSKIRSSSLQNERFARDFLKKFPFEVCKTSISYKTSSKSHASSLQNERFVQDFLQKSRGKSPKALRTKIPKVTRQEHFVQNFLQKSSGKLHRSAHIMKECQAVSRFEPLQTTPAHTPIPMSQRHSPPPQLATSRFPAPGTCHENLHVHTSSTHKVLRLPRNVTSATPRNLTIPGA